MTIDEVLEFARNNHRAVLGTFRQDGGMQLAPVLLAADEDGTLAISTRETAMKTKNLRRNPRAHVCIMNDQFYGQFAQAEGPVTIESLPDAMEGLIRYYRLVSGEHPDWDDYRAAMTRDRRVIIRIPVERAGPNVSG